MKTIPILLLVLFFSAQGLTQNTFGVEIRTSINTTHNSSLIKGAGYGYGGFEVTKELNPTTLSYSVGIMYSIKQRSIFKVHIGKHQNGRIFDLTEYDDMLSYYDYKNVDYPYNYLQIVPSYSYRLNIRKIKIPIELGFAINKRIKEEDIFFTGINEYNYDIRLSSGILYNINNFEVGCNFLYSKAIKGYENDYIVSGEYIPYQFGIELSLGYTFKREKKITNRVDGPTSGN